MRQRVAALIETEGQLLYVRQHARGPSGRHDGPLSLTPAGGVVEQGESLVDAVVREVREEVAMIVEPGDPTLGIDPEIEGDRPRLVGMAWGPAPAKCSGLEWFDLDALPSAIPPYERLVLEGWRDGSLLPSCAYGFGDPETLQ